MDWAGIDEWIYRRLTELVDVLPMRFVKLVAHNYTDARVRKLYWRRLGLEMGEGTYANLGLTLLSCTSTACGANIRCLRPTPTHGSPANR